MGVPTLVYHFYSNGLSQPASGLATVAFTIRLERPSRAGNCQSLWVAYDNGDTITSITDNKGQTWPTAEATADAGAGNCKLSLFVLPNCAADVQAITINFSSSTHPCVWYQEHYNVALTSAVAQNKTATPTGNTVAAGSFSSSPTSGNLILHGAISGAGKVGDQSAHATTGLTAGTGFTLLAGSFHVDTNNPFGIQSRIADGSALNATMTITQVTHDAFCTIAVELVAADAGTAPPSGGVRILKTQYIVVIAASTSFTEPFPYQGDEILVRTTINATTTLLTDSTGNTWVKDSDIGSMPKVQHTRPAAPDSTCKITFVTSTQPNCTFLFNDLIGTHSTQDGAIATNTGTTGSSDTEITAAPTITPLYAGSHIFVTTSIGHGPLTDLHSPTPAGAIFGCSLYPEETDFDTFCNADGYANYENGASLSAVNFTYRWNVDTGGTSWAVGSAESWQGVAIEVRSAPDAALAGMGYIKDVILASTRPGSFKPGIAR